MRKAVTCTQCGTKMRAGIRLCTKCGYELRSAEAIAKAAAAQAEEAAANLLSEEELAAIEAAEAAPAVQEDAPAEVAPTVEAAPAAPVEEAPAAEEAAAVSPSVQKQIDKADATQRRTAEASQSSLQLKKAKADVQGAKRTAKADAKVASAENAAAARRLDADNASRVEAARLEGTVATAEAKAAKRESANAARLSAITVTEKKKAAKLQARQESENLRAAAKIEKRDAARAAREEKSAIAQRSFDSRVADVRQEGELALTAKREKETLRAERSAIARRDEDFRTETRDARAVEKGLRAEEKKAAKHRRAEAEAAVLEKKAETRMLKQRVSMERAQLKHRATSEEEMQELRLREELRSAKRLSSDRKRATRALLAEESKAATRPNEELRASVEEKAFENHLHAKQAAAERKVRRRREADVKRVAAKQAAVRERETRRLGAVEYKAASVNLSAEAADARRRATEAEREMESRRREEKLADREAVAEKKLIRMRASDRDKHSRTKAALRAKEVRQLGRAEMRALRVTKTDEVAETRRQTDEVKLHISQKQQEEKLYEKKLAAERRLIKTRAASADRLQREEIRNQEMLHTAQELEDSRASRIRTDDSRRAVDGQKKQDAIYKKKKTADDKLAEREHRLEMKRVRATTDRDARVMARREKEQRQNLRLAEQYEKDAVKRAKKIAKISGVPVSLVPALSGEASPSALLTAGGAVEAGVPALCDPDTLLATSYESNRQQYQEYKKKKKKEVSRLRYAEIGVRNDKKYFNTIYENGEVMVAKRTVYVARLQSILAVLLMVCALVTSLLPMYTVRLDADVPGAIYNTVLDGQETISFETLLTNGQTPFTSIPEYLLGLVSRFTSGDVLQSITTGVTSYIEAYKQANADNAVLSYLGTWVVFVLLAVGMLLTPIVILINLIVGIVRLVCRAFGKSVAVTRNMKNLRACYTMLGFYILPLLLLDFAPMIGLWVLLGVFGLAIVLNFLLNIVKKYEKADRRYLALVQVSGLIRLALLVGFLFLVGMSDVFGVTGCGDDRTKMLISFGLLGAAYLLIAFCSRGVTTLAFEVVGYTKGQTVVHAPLVISGIVGAALIAVPRYVLGTIAVGDMALVAAVVLVAFAAVTAVFGFIKHIVAKRNCLIDPILDAISEGYPLK